MNKLVCWDDFRWIQAIASNGSLSGAARVLGTSHATVYRRLGAIEQRLGTRLFERSRSGYRPTVAGEELATAAKQIESQVVGAERRVLGQDLVPTGTVRITTLDSLYSGFLASIFTDFVAEHDGINLEISLSNQLFSLSRREADLAIRPTMQPDESLIGAKLGLLNFAVYTANNQEVETSDFHQASWVGPDQGLIYPELESWMKDQQVDGLCRFRVDSVLGLYSAVLQGGCYAVLPRYLGDSNSQLSRISDSIPELSTDLWLVAHPDLRKTTRVRILFDYLKQKVKAELEPDR